jgi:hypothetical protein
MQYHALFVPADTDEAIEVIHIDPATHDFGARIGTPDLSVMSFRTAGFTVTLPDNGGGRTWNPRLGRLIGYGRDLYGSAYILGCDPGGEYADVPMALTLRAAGGGL